MIKPLAIQSSKKGYFSLFHIKLIRLSPNSTVCMSYLPLIHFSKGDYLIPICMTWNLSDFSFATTVVSISSELLLVCLTYHLKKKKKKQKVPLYNGQGIRPEVKSEDYWYIRF